MDIPVEVHILIFQFLSIVELCECEKVSKYWNNILLSPNASQIYSSINMQKREGSLSLNWLKKKISNHQPTKLNFSGCRFESQDLASLLSLSSFSLINLDISFHYLSHGFFPNLSLYTLERLIINDAKLKDNNLEIILQLPSLKYLNMNYNSALIGKPFTYTDTALKALWFEGCERIEYFNILTYLQRHGMSLTELGIDGEYYSSSEVCTLVQFAPNLVKFAIEFANEMDSQLVDSILKPDWQYLKIRRALMIPQLSYIQFFQLYLSELVYLNLAECNYIDDFICTLIAQNCCRITSFVLTWCSEVSDLGISQIVKKCEKLKYLDLTGLKEITDLSFPLENLGIYLNLDTIILEKCNKISDEHLWRLSELYPDMKIKNYYGEFKEGWTGISISEMKSKKKSDSVFIN